MLVTCTLDAARKQMPCLCVTTLIAARGRERDGGKGDGVFVSCVFIARPGNNNWLLFITRAQPCSKRTNVAVTYTNRRESLSLAFLFFLFRGLLSSPSRTRRFVKYRATGFTLLAECLAKRRNKNTRKNERNKRVTRGAARCELSRVARGPRVESAGLASVKRTVHD